MGLFSRFERVTHPSDGTAPGTPEEVREALLARNRPDAPLDRSRREFGRR
ncbi:hypothetical protein [Streptomyces sp. CC224B]|nr:hypothetical protein [Streptomyces sp. CC224B]